MKLLSCVGCVSEGRCERANSMRDRMKGMHIRTVKFGCPIREDRFKPGRPVIFTIKMSRGDDEGGFVLVGFEGYAIKQNGSKLFGFIKPGTMDVRAHGYTFEGRSNGYVKVPLSRVTFDHTRAWVSAVACDWCGNHPQMGAACRDDPEFSPTGKCLANASPTLSEPEREVK